MLLDVMMVGQREELKRRHMGNLIWCVARFVQPDADLPSYADFAERLDRDTYGTHREVNVGEAIENMISTFLPKRGETNGAETV